MFNGGNIELYPHPVANQQLRGLSVIYRSSGQWSVTGGSGVGVDDYPSALAGAAMIAKGTRLMTQVAYSLNSGYGNEASEDEKIRDYQHRLANPLEDWTVATGNDILDYF